MDPRSEFGHPNPTRAGDTADVPGMPAIIFGMTRRAGSCDTIADPSDLAVIYRRVRRPAMDHRRC